MVVEPEYQEVREFSENRAAVKTAKGWAYLDARGVAVTAALFEAAEPFHEGFAAVKVAGRYGFINADGVQVIPPQHAWVGRFAEGVAPVRREADGPMMYVDPTGQVAIDPAAKVCLPFSGGRAAVLLDEKWGFIDRAGRWVVKPLYDQVCWTGGFRNGLCMVKLKDKYGYIDPTGAVVIPIKYWGAWPFSEGVAHVEEKNDETGDWGYIDTSGRLVFDQKRASTQCSNGLIRMQVQEGYVFLDRTGKEVIPKLEHATDFSEGVAAFAVNVNHEGVRKRMEQIRRQGGF
jgi:hypothetical protein